MNKSVLTIFSFLFVFTPLLFCQYQLEIKVVDSDLNPLPGATVLLVEQDRVKQSDKDGWTVFSNVPEGSYKLVASYGISTGNAEIHLDSDLTYSLVIKARVGLEEIQVLSSRVSDAGPLSFTNIEAEEIQKRNYGQDVPFLLKQLPSVTTTSDAGTGIGYTGIRIRGVDPTRINVQMNGIPINDSESQGVFWVNMPDLLSSVDNIQVQRGVGTSAMGGNSFGGIVNINTNRVDPDFFIRTDFSGGSFNTRRASVNFNSGLSEGGYYAEGRVSRIKSDGYIDRATADLTSFFVGLGRVGERSSIRFNLIHGEEVTYQAWNGVPAEFLDDPDLRTFNSAGMNRPDKPHPNEVDDYMQTHLQFFYNYTHSDRWESGLTLHYTRGKGFFEQYRSNDRYSSYGLDPVVIGDEEISRTDLIRRRWLDNDFYGLIANTQYRFTPHTTFTLGTGWNHYIGDHFGEVIWARMAPQIETDYRYYENDADKYDFNIFTKVEHQMGDLLTWLDLQFRSVDYRFLGFDRLLENVDQEQNLTFFNPKGGVTWLMSDQSNVYASLAISNREPNRRDYTESSPDSRPRSERMYNLEAGYRSSGPHYHFQGNVYYMGYKDQLVPTGQINDVGSIVRENVEDSYRMGVELVGSYSLFPNLRLFANLTLSENKIRDYELFVDEYDQDFNFIGQQKEVYESTPMALSPQKIIGAGLSWTPVSWDSEGESGRLEVDLFSQYLSRQYLDNTGNKNNSIDPFYYTDLNLSFILNKEKWPGLSLNFAVRNITDQLYETNGWSYSYYFDGQRTIDQGYYPQAGRNYLLGLSFTFR